MLKKTAIQLLGGTPKKAAESLGYKSAHAIYMWPEVLPRSVTDKVNGALVRLAPVDSQQGAMASGASAQT